MSNPFAAATAASQGLASNPFATAMATQTQTQAPTSTSTINPFATANPSSTTQNGATAANPFASAGGASPFASLSNATNSPPVTAFGQPGQPLGGAPTPFATAAVGGTQKRKNAFDDKAGPKRWGSSPASQAFQKPHSSFTTNSNTKAGDEFGGKNMDVVSKGVTNHLQGKTSHNFGSTPAAPGKDVISKGQKKSPSAYVKEIHDQLHKDNLLKPPPWPKNPGHPDNFSEVDGYRVSYKQYEAKVRGSLIKAGLIDDPNVRKKLSDAIDFRGICEDMCPEGEKISRIVEHDVKLPEKKNGGYPEPDLMVKSFKRSAAGMDSPLPTEVRSPAALRRTLDYLINDVLKGDEYLSETHGFLWDRTRAVRKDFIFQNAMSPQERMDQIYCLENITRFHAVSLHLLSKSGKEDFSEQQEREQLGKTLLSLIQVYDECKDMNLQLDNEAEFRAYYMLFNAHDPFVMQQLQDWDDKFWFESKEIQTVVTLTQVMQNVWTGRGPMRPAVPLTTGAASFTSYFSIVEDPQVSYTMGCLAEIHFTEIRRLILKSIHRSYGRVRDGPKDLTAKVLNDMFRFDTEEECVAFLQDLDMEFSTEGASEPYMIVERRKSLPTKTIKQSFSQALVERKRGNHSLPEVVHTTVFEEASPAIIKTVDSADSLFVTQPPGKPSFPDPNPAQMEINFSDDDSPSSTPAPVKQAFAPPPTSSSTNSFISAQDKPRSGLDAAVKTSFFSQLSNPILTPSADKTITASQTPAFPSLFNTPTPSSSVLPKPDQPQQEMPKSSFPPTQNTTTSPAHAQEGISNIFGSMKPQASLFPSTPAPNSSAPSSIFSSLAPLGGNNQAASTTPKADRPAPKTQNRTSISESFPSSATSIFPGATPAPPAMPSLFAPSTPRSMTPTNQTLQATKQQIPSNMPTFSVEQAAKQAPPPTRGPATPQPLPKPTDMMGDLAEWVLLGDGGLMEGLQEGLVEHIVRETFERFQEDERDRIRRQEDEKSWTEARKFRKYSLGVKYFYRWREIARKRSLKRLGGRNRDKLKAYRAAKAAEARAARAKKSIEEQARLKRATGPTSWLDELEKDRTVKRAKRESVSLGTSTKSSPASDADALLATGILGGMPNKQAIAASCVRDDDSIYDALVGVHISPASKRQVMGPPAKPIKDPLHSVRNGGISKLPPKQKWSKKAQALADMLSGKHKEEDLISFRSGASSRLGQSVRSVPAGDKITNFSKYQSASPRSSAEPDRAKCGPSSGIKSSYWQLRRRGLFATPTGHVLSDKIPRPRTGSFYDSASQYSGDSEIGDYDDRVLEQDGAYRASLGLTGAGTRRSTFSVSAGAAGSPPQPGFIRPSALRQSLPAGGLSTSILVDKQPGDVDVTSQAGSAMSTMQQDVEETLRELRKVAAEMDEDTNWYREQNRQLSESHDIAG